MKFLNRFEVEMYVDLDSWVIGVGWLGYRLHGVSMKWDITFSLLCIKVMIRT